MIIIKYLLMGLTIIVSVLLSACSQNEDVIKNKNSFNTLFIQKVVENSSSEEMTKIINDHVKIEKILSMIEGLKVKESNSDNIFDEIKSQDTYMFAFFEGKMNASGKDIPFAITVLEDGTFIFYQHNDNSHKNTSISIDKHKDLLKEMIQLLEVNF